MITKKRTSISYEAISSSIQSFLANNPSQIYNYKQIAKGLGINKSAIKGNLIAILDKMASTNEIKEAERGGYQYNSRLGFVTGKVSLTTFGTGYIISEETEEDIFVSQKKLRTAMNGDIVKVHIYPKSKEKKQLEGEIVEILERSRTRFVGKIQLVKNIAFLVTNKKQISSDIFIPKDMLKGAKNGEKVVVEITQWVKDARCPFGKVVEVLGKAGDNNTEIHAILEEYNLPYKFTEKVEADANKIRANIGEEVKKRKDFREVFTFTIDPFDAKDFDDAISLKRISETLYEVGVHIADVSYYVQPDTLLDKEAYRRGTSVYLVDRVVPMLPEKLSNNLCSLKPNEDKLCFAAVFEITDKGEVRQKWFGRTIINSDKRFSYEEAQQILDSGDGEYSKDLKTLDKIAKELRRQRFAKGSINFEREEVKFKLDERGKPLGVILKQNKDSNKLIEEFMLLANKYVAELIGNQKKPKTFVYRVHDEPNPDKLKIFAQIASKFGYNIVTKGNTKIIQSINKALLDVEGKNEQHIIEMMAVRSMSRAEYSTDNVGHYGLNFEFYTHFTSPIRRYPDLIVHRLLERYLDGKQSVEKDKYEEKCKYLSGREQVATEAERDSIKFKQAEYLSDKKGESYEGIISGVTQWGIYVEINENKCEGMIAIRNLRDDFYTFDEANMRIVGERNKQSYQLGDKIKIRVAGVDVERKRIDFDLV